MKNMWKKVMSIMLVCMMTVSLVACGEKEKGTSTASTDGKDGAVTLRFSWWGGNSRHEKTLAAIKAFEEKYPNIKIAPEYSGWSGYQEKQTTQMSGGTEADIMQVNWNWLTLFSNDGNGYYDMNQVSDIINLNNYPKEMLNLTTKENKLNAIPIGSAGRAFYWNKDTFDKAGVPIPKTFDDLEKAAATMKEKLGKNYYPLDMDNYSVFLLSLYMAEQKTGKPFIENNKVAYTEEELAQGFDRYLDFVKKGVVPSVEERSGAGNVTADQMPNWIEGRYAGTYEWDSSIKKFASVLKTGADSIVTGPFLDKEGTHKASLMKVSMCYAISKNCKQPKEAATFINFMLTDPKAVEIIGTDRGIPVNPEAVKVLEETKQLSGISYEGHKLAEEYKGADISPYFEDTALQDMYKQTVEQMGYGQLTSKEAAKKIIDTVNQKLATVK